MARRLRGVWWILRGTCRATLRNATVVRMVRYHEDYLVSNKGGLVGALNIAHSLGRRSLVDKLGNIITAVRLGGQDRSILRIS